MPITRATSKPTNGPGKGLYASRAANRPAEIVEGRVVWLTDLARAGLLAQTASELTGTARAELTGAAYDVVWPIVFHRLTRRLELNRGHLACASGVDRLTDDCLDRFHDDVEAVIEDLLTHARQPIAQLGAWITVRLTAATVDGHRRLRGRRGALQRPRLPRWVADGLDGDAWLTALATEILVWVGVSATAGAETWPLEAWAQRRGLRTGDWTGSDPAVVRREVDRVLAVMRRRPAWYESYVERPLGAKQAPVASAPVDEAAPLALADPQEEIDAELIALAAEAVHAIDRRIGRGEQAEQVVIDVIRTVFGRTLPGTLGRAPHATADPLGGVTGALADAATVDRIVTTVLAIIGHPAQRGATTAVNSRDRRDDLD